MSKNSGRYSDIIDLPHHQSIYRPHMTIYNRAAQFAPFAALVGYEQMTKDTADMLLLDKRVILSEDQKNILDREMQKLMEEIKQHPKVTVVYFNEAANKIGGSYDIHNGKVKKIEEFPAMIVFEDGKKIKVEDIDDLKVEL